MPPKTRSQTAQESPNKRVKTEASPQSVTTSQRSQHDPCESNDNVDQENNVKTPALSLHSSVQRRIFARIHSEFSVQDWRRVVWNTTFRINDLKFWACLTYKGLGSIVQVDLEKKKEWEEEDRSGRIVLSFGVLGKNRKTPYEERRERLGAYAGLLQKDITQMMKNQKVTRRQSIFQFIEYIDVNETKMDDWINGSKQKFKSIIYGWPENSLDIHPIGPLIDVLKDKLKTEYGTDAVSEELVVKEWNSIPLEEVQKSIDQTATRLQVAAKQ